MAYKTSKETQIRKDNKRKHIIKTAISIFSQHGYNGTTIKDIVTQADISTGTFYFYFKNKDDLFEIIYDDFIKLLDEVSEFSLKSNIGIAKGFCRSKASEMWIFQNCKGAAKALMIEAAGFNPVFENKRCEILKRSDERIEKIFSGLKKMGLLSIADAKTCAILCNGTMYSIITNWLQEDDNQKLTNYILPIVIFNLNAFQIEYNQNDLVNYINEMLSDMENAFTINNDFIQI